jgi:sporulation protein YlmC with PRC-barrel domain
MKIMKYRLLIPTVAICLGSSFLVSTAGADQTYKSKSTFDTQNTLNVSQVLHSRVLDRSGQKIGDVEDIVMDPTSGRIQFAVLKLSGDLADRGKYTPVPFSLLKPSDTEKKDMFGHRDLILQADREKLLSASRFSAKTWPDTEHVTWGPDVYSHYGVNWDSGFERGGTGAALDSSAGTDQSTVIVREPAPRTYYYYEYKSTARSEKPIDNGTGPDGRDTFHFMPRPWPYHDLTDTH